MIPGMTFSDFVSTVPSWARVLLAAAVTVAITLICLKVFYKQIIKLNQEPNFEDNVNPTIPATYWLSGRVITMTSIAFIFLTAFTLNNFWGTAKTADEVTLSEAQYFSKAEIYARELPQPSQGEALAALENYALSIVNVQQPLLEQADSTQANTEKANATVDLLTALSKARASDPSKSAAWGDLSDAVSELTMRGSDRISLLPGSVATSMIILIMFLGILNLALITAFVPTWFDRNAFLVAVTAVITALLIFVVTEVSNPYLGRGAVTSLLVNQVEKSG